MFRVHVQRDGAGLVLLLPAPDVAASVGDVKRNEGVSAKGEWDAFGVAVDHLEPFLAPADVLSALRERESQERDGRLRGRERSWVERHRCAKRELIDVAEGGYGN